MIVIVPMLVFATLMAAALAAEVLRREAVRERVRRASLQRARREVDVRRLWIPAVLAISGFAAWRAVGALVALAAWSASGACRGPRQAVRTAGCLRPPRIRPVVRPGRDGSGKRTASMGVAPQRVRTMLGGAMCLALLAAAAGLPAEAEQARNNLIRAKVFLAAGDYRHAIEMCQKEVEAAPSVESYVYLTYAYHALNGYLDHLARTDQWVKVEQLYVNLAFRDLDALTIPPEILARMAKEIIHESADRQADCITTARSSVLPSCRGRASPRRLPTGNVPTGLVTS